MPELVKEYQTRFIRERNILDGIVVTHETIHQTMKERWKEFIFKLNFEKEYDRVN